MDRILWTFEDREGARRKITVVGTESAQHFVEVLTKAEAFRWRVRRQSWVDWRGVDELGKTWGWENRIGTTTHGLPVEELPQSETPSLGERRRFERLEGKIPFELKLPEGIASRGLGQIRDLSLGGARLCVPEGAPSSIGARFRIQVKFPQLRLELDRIAEVVETRDSMARVRFLVEAGEADRVELGLLMTQLLAQKVLKFPAAGSRRDSAPPA